MYLLVGLFIGTLYGRNAREVNQRTHEDIQKAWSAFSKTKFALHLYYVADSLYDLLSGLNSRQVVYTHDMLCTCNRGRCRTPSINTYVRKLKAAT